MKLKSLFHNYIKLFDKKIFNLENKTHAMPFTQIYLHIVWSTKNRKPYLNSPKIRNQTWSFIREYAKTKSIFLIRVNGYNDHCHALISLGRDQKLQEVVQLLKGASSFWINRQDWMSQRFRWQSEYYANSISPENLDSLIKYIEKQESHHRKKTFQQEYKALFHISE